MDIVIKVLGIVFVCMGIVYILKPEIIKNLMLFFRKGKRLYVAGLVRFALAIVFLLGARECDITWLITAFGIIFLISGLLVFTLGLEKLKAIIDWYQTQPILLLRVIALIVLVVGALIIYAA